MKKTYRTDRRPPLKRHTLGLVTHDADGKPSIAATISVLARSAHAALRKMKQETEGAHLCILNSPAA